MIECQNIEFKREISDKISRTIVAFANTNGGRLFIGIDDNGEAIGVNDIDKVQLAVKNILRDSIRPDVSLFTTLNVENVDGKYVLRIDVGRGTLRRRCRRRRTARYRLRWLRPDQVFYGERGQRLRRPANEIRISPDRACGALFTSLGMRLLQGEEIR
ncbi:MAG: ATP-binding protein [Lentisphaerae bacterium]|nr:ATP-binding protein [Lentisphaerota bacterium]